MNSSEKDAFLILHLNIWSLNKKFENLRTFLVKLGFGFQIFKCALIFKLRLDLSLNNKEMEAFAIEIINKNSRNILINTQYRHPSSKDRSSPPKVFLGKGVLKIYNKSTGEYQWQSVVLIKLLCNFILIAPCHGWSPINLLHIFRTPP